MQSLGRDGSEGEGGMIRDRGRGLEFLPFLLGNWIVELKTEIPSNPERSLR